MLLLPVAAQGHHKLSVALPHGVRRRADFFWAPACTMFLRGEQAETLVHADDSVRGWTKTHSERTSPTKHLEPGTKENSSQTWACCARALPVSWAEGSRCILVLSAWRPMLCCGPGGYRECRWTRALPRWPKPDPFLSPIGPAVLPDPCVATHLHQY